MENVTKPTIKVGQRVKLVEVTPDMITRGLKIGMLGTVRHLSHSSELGVEFEGYSDVGWNTGLHVTSTGYHRADGTYVQVVDLCELLPE